MKKINVFALVMGCLVLVSMLPSCKQNPFPEVGRMVQKQPLRREKAFPPLILEVPPSTTVFEGQPLELEFRAEVSRPGIPLVSVQGLPEGAKFDPEAMAITWTPDYDAANDPRDFSVIVRTYRLDFRLSSSENPGTSVTRQSVIIVRDVARGFKVDAGIALATVREGTLFERVINVKSDDYPEGPFVLQIPNMPVGMEVIEEYENDPTKFKISYTPSYHDVVLTGSGSYTNYVDRNLDIKVFGPRGINVTTPFTLRIQDERAKPVIVVPSEITQGTSASFTVVAEDPNGEEPPLLSLKPRPLLGKAELKIERENGGDAARGVNPSVVATYRWTQIPAEMVGQTKTVTFEACVLSRRHGRKEFCSQATTQVNFEVEQRPTPIIDRLSYPLGEIQFVREQQRRVLRVPVRDAEVISSIRPTVEVFPESMREEVKWDSGNLVIQGKKAGFKQFSLVATSTFGVRAVESFMLEVLPWSWSPVLFFGESLADQEAKRTGDFFESVQVANPAFQTGDPRLAVLRDVVFLGTGAFHEPSAVVPMERIASGIEKIVVSTPLVGRLEGELHALAEAVGIAVGAPIADWNTYSLEVAPGSGLTPPSDPIRLGGKLSSASTVPVGLVIDDKNGRCTPWLKMRKADAEDIVVAAGCRRPAKGLLVLAGFEFADIQTSALDNRIVRKWMTDNLGEK